MLVIIINSLFYVVIMQHTFLFVQLPKIRYTRWIIFVFFLREFLTCRPKPFFTFIHIALLVFDLASWFHHDSSIGQLSYQIIVERSYSRRFNQVRIALKMSSHNRYIAKEKWVCRVKVKLSVIFARVVFDGMRILVLNFWPGSRRERHCNSCSS